MRRVRAMGWAVVVLATMATAQVGGGPGGGQKDAAPAAARRVPAGPQLSDGARTAMAAARAVARKAKGLEGDERLAALQAGAAAYDAVAEQFAAEGPAAAQASFAAADCWRRQGSADRAERAYLAAARLDPERYGQRGTLGAADMQRRQERDDDALATYAAVAAIDPASSSAHVARVWRGRLLRKLDRRDEAVGAFRAAVDAAGSPTQSIEACNYLARMLVDAGDLDGAGAALGRAEAAVRDHATADPEQRQRWQKALETMSARRALQRARDKKDRTVGDAELLEWSQRNRGGDR